MMRTIKRPVAVGSLICLLGWSGVRAGGADPDDHALSGCFCVGTTGNVNCDYADQITLADLSLLIDHLFITGVRLPSLEEANIDGDPYGVIELADAALLIDHLFIARPDLPACPEPPNAPPETRIAALVPSVPFIDGPVGGAATVGVRLTWTADDRIDHPYFPPPFAFEYRLYGPYSDSLVELVRDSFMVPVFRTSTGELLEFGLAEDTVGCDTIWSGGQIDTIICRTVGTHYTVCDTAWDGGVRTIVCDTVLIDTLLTSTSYGRIDTLFDVDNPSFLANPELCRIVAASYEDGDVWTFDTTETMYDLFAGHHADTTQQQHFIFWVRARDPIDSTLYDPTPALGRLTVIDPRFERDLLVLNWTANAHENRAQADSVRTGWQGLIDGWLASGDRASPPVFDPGRDLKSIADVYSGYDLLELVLKYKMLIVHQDAAVSGTWNSQGILRDQAMVAVATGVNVWVAARVPIGNHSFGSGPATDVASSAYTRIFGVERTAYSGWARGFYDDQDGLGFGLPRVEHFVGAFSESPTQWPDLTVDTALLHQRYDWDGGLDPLVFPFYPFLPEIGALPEVGWARPAPEAEIMYRYRSLYGDVHPTFPELSYQGNPVMHRLDGGSFRTVHSMFTPLALEAGTAGQMVIAVLNWLYPSEFKTDFASSRSLDLIEPDYELRDWYREWRRTASDRMRRER